MAAAAVLELELASLPHPCEACGGLLAQDARQIFCEPCLAEPIPFDDEY